jgi:hypothetical protein
MFDAGTQLVFRNRETIMNKTNQARSKTAPQTQFQGRGLKALPSEVIPIIATHANSVRDIQALACTGKAWRIASEPLLRSVHEMAMASAYHGKIDSSSVALPGTLPIEFAIDYASSRLCSYPRNKKTLLELVQLSTGFVNLAAALASHERFVKTFLSMRGLSLAGWHRLLEVTVAVVPDALGTIFMTQLLCFHPVAKTVFFEQDELQEAQADAYKIFESYHEPREKTESDSIERIGELIFTNAEIKEDDSYYQLCLGLWNFALTRSPECMVEAHRAAWKIDTTEWRVQWIKNAFASAPKDRDVLKTLCLSLLEIMNSLAETAKSKLPGKPQDDLAISQLLIKVVREYGNSSRSFFPLLIDQADPIIKFLAATDLMLPTMFLACFFHTRMNLRGTRDLKLGMYQAAKATGHWSKKGLRWIRANPEPHMGVTWKPFHG